MTIELCFNYQPPEEMLQKSQKSTCDYNARNTIKGPRQWLDFYFKTNLLLLLKVVNMSRFGSGRLNAGLTRNCASLCPYYKFLHICICII